MTQTLLLFLLRLAGCGLILLALMHVPIARRLDWRQDMARLTSVNASIFWVHNLFICLVLVLMGIGCLVEPAALLEKSRAARWCAWSLAVFWLARLYCQFFVYSSALWRGKRLETLVHCAVSFVWLGLTLVFGFCALYQSGWVNLQP